MDATRAKAIRDGFNGAMGTSGLKQGWSNLKAAFGGATTPGKAPTNVAPAQPPIPTT